MSYGACRPHATHTHTHIWRGSPACSRQASHNAYPHNRSIIVYRVEAVPVFEQLTPWKLTSIFEHCNTIADAVAEGQQEDVAMAATSAEAEAGGGESPALVRDDPPLPWPRPTLASAPFGPAQTIDGGLASPQAQPADPAVLGIQQLIDDAVAKGDATAVATMVRLAAQSGLLAQIKVPDVRQPSAFPSAGSQPPQEQ